MKKIFIIWGLLVAFVFMMSAPVVAGSTTKKWQFPKKIKTYIPQNNKRTVMMEHAFREWSKVTNDEIIFRYVQSKNTADIIVEFVEVVPNAEREIGLTRYSYSSRGTLRKATIYIAEKTASGRKLGNDSVYTVMLHEIGHAIGIEEHSKDPYSIMYAIENDVQEILDSDIKTVEKIYGL